MPEPEHNETLLFHQHSRLRSIRIINPIFPTLFPLLFDSLGATSIRDVALCLQTTEIPRQPDDVLAPLLVLDDLKLDHLFLNERFDDPRDLAEYFERGGLGHSLATGFTHIAHLTLPLHFATSWPDFVRDHPNLVHLSLFNGDPDHQITKERISLAELYKTVEAGSQTSLAKLSVDALLNNNCSVPLYSPKLRFSQLWVEDLADYALSHQIEIEIKMLELDGEFYCGKYDASHSLMSYDSPAATTDEEEDNNDDQDNDDGKTGMGSYTEAGTDEGKHAETIKGGQVELAKEPRKSE